MQRALDLVFESHLHVVAKIIETQFVVRSVGNVASVLLFSLFADRGHVGLDRPDRQAQRFVNRGHPVAVALDEVVVDGDHVDLQAQQDVDVTRQRCDEGFAFAGCHFRDFSFVQDSSADHLDVKMPMAVRCRFAASRTAANASGSTAAAHSFRPAMICCFNFFRRSSGTSCSSVRRSSSVLP